MKLAVVTTHFNPCGFSRLAQNYLTFQRAIDAPLLVVEASYDGTFIEPMSIQIDATDDNFMWQKERMINVGIHELPSDIDVVAWVDADIIFKNSDWIEDALWEMKKFPVAQLFETLSYLNADGSVCRSSISFASHMRGRRVSGTQTVVKGGAWVARREIVEKGLYDLDVVGGGDTSCVNAWTGELYDGMGALRKTMRHRKAFVKWAISQHKLVRGSIGMVRGHVDHLFHGDKTNRRYQSRHRILMDSNFDPETDIEIGPNRLWRWSTDKPAMHAGVRDYFLNRREDD